MSLSNMNMNNILSLSLLKPLSVLLSLSSPLFNEGYLSLHLSFPDT